MVNSLGATSAHMLEANLGLALIYLYIHERINDLTLPLRLVSCIAVNGLLHSHAWRITAINMRLLTIIKHMPA